MARAKNPVESRKIQPAVSEQVLDYLAQLVEVGAYGSTPTEVARYLIHRGIDDLIRANIIGPRRPKDRDE